MKTEASSYVPPEDVLSQTLPRLPVRSLLRFRCVCKAWRHTIDGDYSFHSEHLSRQKTSLLLAPQIIKDHYWARETITTAGLYRWERSQGSATLVHGMADYHKFDMMETAHDLAHCDGLVLLPSEHTVRVLNPATRRILTLPWSPRIRLPRHGCDSLHSHQAFGLGHDTSSNVYKVAHFFYLTIDITGCRYTLGMEIFTVGTDQNWRDIKNTSPYPIEPGRTATFCKGSLFWSVERSLLKDKKNMPGFICLNLQDESFSVVSPPPCSSLALNVNNTVSRLANLRGELCLAHSGPDYKSLDIWICNGLDDNPSQWDRHYVIALDAPMFARGVCPKAMFDDEIVLQFEDYSLLRYNYRTGEFAVRDTVKMHELRYGNPDDNDATGTLVEYSGSTFHAFEVIPYVPSLAPV